MSKKMGKISLLVGIAKELQDEIDFIEERNKVHHDLTLIGMVLGLELAQLVLEKYHVGWPKQITDYDPNKNEYEFLKSRED
jgi:hypothetical protein